MMRLFGLLLMFAGLNGLLVTVVVAGLIVPEIFGLPTSMGASWGTICVALTGVGVGGLGSVVMIVVGSWLRRLGSPPEDFGQLG